MKTGMNLLLWTTHVTDQLFPLFAKLKATGFDGVEIPLFEGDAAHYKSIAAELNSLLNRVEKIQGASNKRLLKQNHDGELRGELVMMLFETLEAEAPPKARKRQSRSTGKSKARA